MKKPSWDERVRNRIREHIARTGRHIRIESYRKTPRPPPKLRANRPKRTLILGNMRLRLAEKKLSLKTFLYNAALSRKLGLWRVQ